MHDGSLKEKVRASGLFDPDFYRKTYAPGVESGEALLEHFLGEGLPRGYLPSAGFDPVLYRILVPECGEANPLLHCLASGKPFRPPPLAEIFPGISLEIRPKPGAVAPAQPAAGGRPFRAQAAADAREIPFLAAGRRYTMRIPDPSVMIERFRNDRPFAFARLPHGFWDALWMLSRAEAGVAAHDGARGLSAAQRRALAGRYCAAARRGKAAVFEGAFMDEVLADIPLHAGHPDFLRGVSFVGMPDWEDDVWGRRNPLLRDPLLALFAQHYRPEEPVYDALLWKRWLLAGRLGELARFARERPVVLVANDSFATLGERWALADFIHIRIPPRHSQRLRWGLLQRVADALAGARARSARPPLVITQCGGSLAYWLHTRLFSAHPGAAFYIDLGQALNGWFFDVLEPRDSPWMRDHARSVIEDGGLEPFYRERMGSAFDEWMEGLTAPARTHE